jgi:hypothetical protein
MPEILSPFETPPVFRVVEQDHLKVARDRRLAFQHGGRRVCARIRVHKDGDHGNP